MLNETTQIYCYKFSFNLLVQKALRFCMFEKRTNNIREATLAAMLSNKQMCSMNERYVCHSVETEQFYVTCS